MTNIRDKLNEAKFFIIEMERVLSEPDNFRYMLTAFLAANRSITYIMQEEFDKKPGFKKWYAKKQSEMKINPILKYLHELRRVSCHVSPILQYPIWVKEQIANSIGGSVILTGTGSTNTIY